MKIVDLLATVLLVFHLEGHSREGFEATFAGVFLDLRVGLQMGPQVGPVGEGSMALVALEGLLARVRPDVALKQPRSAEGLAADFALARQCVRSDVHLEGSHGGVLLAAVLAAEVVVLVPDNLEGLLLGLEHLVVVV